MTRKQSINEDAFSSSPSSKTPESSSNDPDLDAIGKDVLDHAKISKVSLYIYLINIPFNFSF